MDGNVQRMVGWGALVLAAAATFWFGSKVLDVQGLDQLSVVPRKTTHTVSGRTAERTEHPNDKIRIASFNIQVFGEQKLSKPDVMAVLADCIHDFDVVAIQEIRAKGQDILPRFIDLINAGGRRYDYAIGPRIGRTVSKEQYAFIYDTETIEIDRDAMYTVDDPDDMLHREPLVAGFRAKAAPANEAFTFTLVNIHTDPDETDRELDALAEVFQAVRGDGRGEDDIIIVGDLNVDDEHLGRMGQVPNITAAIYGVPSNTRGTALYDNILFDSRATVEFSGRAGVNDLMKQYKLSEDQALEVSDHFPVWAEFSVVEGGEAGRLATRDDRGVR
ncbi:MAG: endonuclease/exonuclease/phosphatase family protein [Pirellulales bacterium]